MKLNYFEGANTKKDWKENGVWKLKQFFYKQLLMSYVRTDTQIPKH